MSVLLSHCGHKKHWNSVNMPKNPCSGNEQHDIEFDDMQPLVRWADFGLGWWLWYAAPSGRHFMKPCYTNRMALCDVQLSYWERFQRCEAILAGRVGGGQMRVWRHLAKCSCILMSWIPSRCRRLPVQARSAWMWHLNEFYSQTWEGCSDMRRRAGHCRSCLASVLGCIAAGEIRENTEDFRAE